MRVYLFRLCNRGLALVSDRYSTLQGVYFGYILSCLQWSVRVMQGLAASHHEADTRQIAKITGRMERRGVGGL